MLSCNYSESLVITYAGLSWGLIYSEIIWWIFFLSMNREEISPSLSRNTWCRWWSVGVALNVHNALSLCQQRKLLCISFSLNTLCRWLTVMDRNLCTGLSTDGTTQCCRHVCNGWQSTLKNLYVVNTCPQWCRWHWLLQWIVSPVLKIPYIT